MNWFVQGGWPMYPILICSVAALAAIIERTVVFLLTMENPRRVLKESEQGDPLRRRGLCSAVAAAYAAAPREEEARVFEESVYQAGKQVIRSFSSRIAMLAVIAHLTPLMGLFGTVLGMIGVFQGLQDGQGRAEISALAGGIWVALLTTAFGLAVAIPAFAAHHIFEAIIRRRTETMEALLPELNRIFNRSVAIEAGGNTEEESRHDKELHEDVYSA
ncbi:MotA/TolQ/ExbB proton channel family protein [Marispirochaeta sp.]|uniref:MotA/TolQ/ExbB proton channel family protein n=1 Tax=Marispirochaeta sp. TaxID=2038653 RepID=UPI0029C8130D|nr:MotA/TolQ/ExbB proton channel family protein [Marispirochaeta sp.]